jgi:hypothetical protein
MGNIKLGGVDRGVQEITLQGWADYFDLIRSREFDDHATLIYRGEGNADWRVMSTLDRLEKKHPLTRNTSGNIPASFECPPASREEHLHAFKAAVRGRRGQHPPDLSEDEWWVLGRHHGLASPVLDWTLSPAVALFFAFEQEKVIGLEHSLIDPQRRAVYALAWHLAAGDKTTEDGPQVFLPTKDLSPRVETQCGVFLKMPKGKIL